jgi:2-polyprenyl-3-methyl-5-hydroxy-6-metoxy-1,4-benzoquinol methylase
MGHLFGGPETKNRVAISTASARSNKRPFASLPVVQSLAIAPPLKVLDLGCGDGTTAIPLARTGADVVGIDIARNLVEAGNKRAARH